MQQIMKTIKLQEQAEKHNKEPEISKPAAKEKEEIEEEMPLKIKGKPRGKLRGTQKKEIIKPVAVQKAEATIKPSDPIDLPLKKEAVFFK